MDATTHTLDPYFAENFTSFVTEDFNNVTVSFIKDILPPKDKQISLSFYIYCITLPVIIISTNCIFIFSLRKYQGIRRSHNMKLLLCNISIAYIIFALAALLQLLIRDKKHCVLRLLAIITPAHVVISSLLLLALEIHLVSKRRNPGAAGLKSSVLRALLGLSWLSWLLLHVVEAIDINPINLPIPCIYGNPYYKPYYVLGATSVVLLHFPVIIGLHVGTLVSFKTSVKQVESRRHTDQAHPADRTILKHLWTYKKFATLVLMKSLLFLLAWGPSYANMVSAYILHHGIMNAYTQKLASIFVFFNALGNFFIYFVYSKEFRRAVTLSITCKTAEVSVVSETPL